MQMDPAHVDGDSAAAIEEEKGAHSLTTRGLLSQLVVLAFAALCVANVMSALARQHWVFELMTHFTVHWMLAGAVFVVLLGLLRKWKLVAIAILIVSFNAYQVRPYVAGQTQSAAESVTLKVLVSNVHTSNVRYQSLIDLISDEQPDFVVLLEVNERWFNRLAPLRDQYPHLEKRVRSDNFGIAVFSRLPLEETRVVEFGGSRLPSIVSRLRINGTAATMIATHPLPPIGTRYAATRDSHMQALAEFVSERDGHVAVMGDLNNTPWSPCFADLLNKSGLKDSRWGRGILPTWPGKYSRFGIPIDHILVSPGIGVTDLRVGDSIGSDHRPMIAELQFTGD